MTAKNNNFKKVILRLSRSKQGKSNLRAKGLLKALNKFLNLSFWVLWVCCTRLASGGPWGGGLAWGLLWWGCTSAFLLRFTLKKFLSSAVSAPVGSSASESWITSSEVTAKTRRKSRPSEAAAFNLDFAQIMLSSAPLHDQKFATEDAWKIFLFTFPNRWRFAAAATGRFQASLARVRVGDSRRSVRTHSRTVPFKSAFLLPCRRKFSLGLLIRRKDVALQSGPVHNPNFKPCIISTSMILCISSDILHGTLVILTRPAVDLALFDRENRRSKEQLCSSSWDIL